MGNKTILEELDVKISLILEKYEALKEENRRLEESINASRETESRLRQEILKLREDDELKELELEDIVARLSKSMGLVTESEEISLAS